MLHHILVKYTDDVTDKQALIPEIEQLFAPLTEVEGIHGVKVCPNVVDRPNRYDVMIVINLEPEALAAYDQSEPHHRWKEEYGHLMAKKAIFDCD